MLTRELGEGERTHTHFWRQKQRIAAKKKKGIGTVVPFSRPLFLRHVLAYNKESSVPRPIST